MKIKRIGVAAAAVAVAGALALTGCSKGGSSTSPSNEVTKTQSLTVAQNSSFYTYNSGSVNGNSVYNSNITYMTGSSFNYYDATPKLVKNTKFGTYKVLSQNPLKISYTVNKGVKWSDGTQVGAADMLLDWVVGQSKYNGGSDGKGAVNFTSASAGLLDGVSQIPTISNDNRTVTITYDKPYVDWEVNFGIGSVAAHAAYEEAFPGTKPAAANADFIKAVQSDDQATLAKVAKSWSTAFDMSGNLPSDKLTYLSDGPYIISDLKKDQYITLVKNPNYNWGPKPKIDKLTVRFIQDPTAQVQALQNGEVSVIEGQADADTVASLKGLSGVTTTSTPTSSYEHIDLTFNNGGPFDPKTYGGDASKAELVRQAFLLTIPRQQIIDNLIKPIQASAKLDESQMFLPGAAGYDESVAANGSSSYDKVDIAKAKSLLQQAGVTGTVNVKFLYGKSNTRRAAEFALIQASAKQAGFNVIDDGDDNWGSILGNGSYDAALFAWSFTSLAVTGNEATFITNGGANYSGYSDAKVDSDFKTLENTFDASQQKTLMADIDKQVWSDAYGVTLFQFPDVTAYSSNVKNVKDAPLSPNVFWNFWEWTK